LPAELRDQLQATPFAKIADAWDLLKDKYGVTPAMLGRADRFYLLTVLCLVVELIIARSREGSRALASP